MSSFFAELQRRNVFKAGLAYAIVAWLLIQIVATVFPLLEFPEWTAQFVTVVILIGFPITLIFAWAFELTPEGIKPALSVVPEQSITRLTGQKLNYIIIGLMALAIAFLVIDNYVLVDEPEAADEPQAKDVPQVVQETISRTKPSTITDKSVAVLPFVSMSSDQKQQYFADGLTEEILNRLAQVQELKVAARTSSFYFKDKNMDISAIGEILDVAYVLEGSVRRYEDTMRVTAQLNRASNGVHVWSRTFDRPLKDIFVVQDEIATDVTKAMQVSLGVAGLSRMPGMTTNVLAYDAYLKATKSFDFTTKELAETIAYLEDAVELDPEFALAWNTLATMYSQTSIILPGGFPDWQMKTMQSITRSFELAPNAPYTIALRTGQSLGMGDWVNAERMINEALTSADQYGVRDEYIGLKERFLILLGRIGDALALLELIKATDPLNEGLSSQLIDLYHAAGDFDAALAEADRGIEHGWGGLRRMGSTFVVALASGDRMEIEKRFALLPTEGSGNAGNDELNRVMMSLIDDRETALAELNDRIIKPEYQTPLSQSIIAIWAAYFDDPELALTGLRGSRRNISVLLNNAWLAIFSDTRKLPGFREMVSELGLANYWRTTGNWADACKPLAGGLTFECE